LATRSRGRLWALLLAFLVAGGMTVHAATHPPDAKLLIVSDLHFDPMADPALVSELAAADPSQWEPILDRTTPAAFSQYGSDTNWWLLKSAMDQFPATLPHPTFIMVTGDLLAHDFPATFRNVTHDSDQQHYRAFVLKTVQFLAMQLQRRFPGTRILLTPGNNDNDCGDYTIEANGTFLDDTAPIARELATGDDELVNNWKALGSFNVPHPALSGVRIISLNSIFLSNKYRALSSSQGCREVSSTAASDLLAWLEVNLAAAAQANQKVWLMFHIPPGIDGYASSTSNGSQSHDDAAANAGTCGNSIVPMWVPEWTTQFDALLAKYRSTVVAGFAGHTHSDDFRLVGPAGPEREFILINPAISPVYKQNPGFRVVSYRSDGAVVDQSTYFLTNLNSASSKSKGRWRLEYTFTRKWKTRELNTTSLGNLSSHVGASERVRGDWLKLYAVSGPAEASEKGIARGLYCAVESLTVESYKACYCSATPKP
jgi:sphingomyelin phosphodiesterase acid-like 3